jgi:hypothetical protein
MADKKPSLATWDPDPDMVRAYGLVGEFMSVWSVLESGLNAAIHKLCKLGPLEGYAVTTNMGVRNKIHTVKTMLNLYSVGEEVSENNKLLDKIANRSEDRNLVAHTQYVAHKSGVEFIVVKAKGELKVPPTVWSVTTFNEKRQEIVLLHSRLKTAVRRVHAKQLGRALMAPNWFATTPTFAGQGLLGGLPIPPPEDHGSQPHRDTRKATPEKSPRTPKAPRTKSPKG